MPDEILTENDEDEDEGGITYAVSPAEDLMREHGVQSRILLIYEESARRMDAGLGIPRDALVSTLDVTRRFVQEYHARLEEEQLQIRAIPTLMVFRDGLLLFRQAGALPAPALEQLLSAVAEIDMNDVRAKLEES